MPKKMAKDLGKKRKMLTFVLPFVTCHRSPVCTRKDKGHGKRTKENKPTQIKQTNKEMKTVYDFKVKDRKGKEVAIKEYANEVLLIVNTAIKCQYTPQYEQLEQLYERFHSRGFEILDFPCNQFGQQAPGTDESIHTFCKTTYNTEFPRFKKVKVSGDDADPLFKFLQEQKGEATWNFTKYLTNKRGMVVARFEPSDNFDGIASQIEALLEQ